MDINNSDIINTIKKTISEDVDSDYYEHKLHIIIDFLISKGFNNKKSNIIEIKHSNGYFIEDGKINSGHDYYPTDNYTLVFSEWATLMHGTYTLYNFNDNNIPEIMVNDDIKVNVLILNGIGLVTKERYNDFTASILQKFIPHISEDCVIIIDDRYHYYKEHGKILLLEHGYSDIGNGIYYYETT